MSATPAGPGVPAGARAGEAARLRDALDQLANELARRLAELRSLQDLAHILSSSLEVDRVASEVARHAMRFTEARGALVALAARRDARLEVVAGEGSLGHCVGRSANADAEGIVMAAVGHERLERGHTETPDGITLCGDVRVASAMAAPLRAHGVTTGAVVVADKAGGGPFSDQDARLLATVATHAAVGLANARFFELVRRGKEQWETTFDALDEGIALVDGEARVQRANAAFARITGRPIPGVIGGHLCRLLFGDHHVLAELLHQTAAGAHPPPLVRRSETLGRMLRIAASPVGEPGADEAAVIVVEDITEQKALEAQLIQSEKVAALGTLVSGVAHELNNPLTSIAGLSEFLLEQGFGSGPEREHLRVINDQAERASRIVRNLLSFARKAPAERAHVDLADVVHRTVLLIGYEMRQAGVTVETAVPAKLPPVLGNRDQIQQVVLNLLTNANHALRSLPEGRERRVAIEVAADEERVLLRVRDTGPGIAADAAAQLFNPFYTTKPPGEGTGLGLFLSYGIAESHGGMLAVDSAPGQGATFTFVLPRATPEALRQDLAPRPEPAVPSAAAPAVRSAAGRRILVVDDDPAVRRLVAVLFAHEGHTVDEAAEGTEALRLAATYDYDLVIADRRAAAGREPFTQALLQERPAWAGRVIVSTSAARAAPEGEPARVLRKPFNLRDLRDAAAAAWQAPA